MMLTTLQKLDLYTVEIAPLAENDGGGYKANYKETALSISGYGATPTEALADLRRLAEGDAEDEPDELWPEPSTKQPWEDFSGRVTLRLPLKLHYDLDALATRQGVSLNTLLVSMLAEGAGRAASAPPTSASSATSETMDFETIVRAAAEIVSARLEPLIAHEVEKRVYVNARPEDLLWPENQHWLDEMKDPVRNDDWSWGPIGQIETPAPARGR